MSSRRIPSDDWDPEAYPEAIRAEVPLYERLQEERPRRNSPGLRE